MKQMAVVYWTGTGNTEAMAQAVADGAREAGAEVRVLTSDAFEPAMADQCSAIAFGCPAMGDEVLEQDEFEPMFTQCLPRLAGKSIALFGSYGWQRPMDGGLGGSLPEIRRGPGSRKRHLPGIPRRRSPVRLPRPGCGPELISHISQWCLPP